MRVISLAKGVYATPSAEDASASFRIVTEAGLNVRSITQGMGILYFNGEPGGKYAPRLTHSLFMPNPQPVGSMVPMGGLTAFDVNIPNRFPCSGVLSPEGVGFLTAPTVKLEIGEGKDTVAMLISPRKEAFEISPEKRSLSIPGDGSEANVVLRSDGSRGVKELCPVGSSQRRFSWRGIQAYQWLTREWGENRGGPRNRHH